MVGEVKRTQADIDRLIAELEDESQQRRARREMREALARKYPTCPCPEAACTGQTHRRPA